MVLVEPMTSLKTQCDEPGKSVRKIVNLTMQLYIPVLNMLAILARCAWDEKGLCYEFWMLRSGRAVMIY